MSLQQYAAGFDIGTTRCNVGIVKDGSTELLYPKGEKLQSHVTFTNTNAIVGTVETGQILDNPSNTVFGIKKFLGRELEDSVVRKMKDFVPFEVTVNDDKTCVKVNYQHQVRYYTPQQVIAFMLESLKKQMEAFIDGEVKDAVIAVPVSFTNAQRQAVREAAAAAGLRVLALVTEAAATAICYQGGRRRIKGPGTNVVIVDMGGGKLDVSILNISDESIDVKAASGSTEVGGDTLVEMFMEMVLDEHRKIFKVFPPRGPSVLHHLRKECQTAVQNLTVAPTVTIHANFFGEEYEFDLNISKDDFIGLANSKIRPTLLAALDSVFKSSGLDKKDIAHIILVGGCTCSEMFRNWLRNYFNVPDLRVDGRSVDNFSAVTEGAAVYAALLSGDRTVREMTVNDLFQNVGSLPPRLESEEPPSQS